eukprot:5276829-Ditylum_brightwellii.AAC.1
MVPPPLKSANHRQLKEQLLTEDPYTLIHLTDPQIGIDSNDIPDQKARLALRAKFIAGIKFVFPVG